MCERNVMQLILCTEVSSFYNSLGKCTSTDICGIVLDNELSIMAHNLWADAGRPSSGDLAKYKII